MCEAYDDATQRSVAEEVAILEKEQEMAAIKVAAVDRDETVAWRPEAAPGDCLAARVRRKLAAVRTGDEKRWVALDVLVNPAAYAHVTELDAEEMKFDPEYAPHLREEDVRRILALPHQLQLALPFLFTQSEIDAHRLLCHFTHEEGEEVFDTRDRTGAGSTPSDDTGVNVTVNQQVAGEQHLDIVLRQRRLARIRAKPEEELAESEAKYLTIDRILHPWLYATSPDDTVLEIPSATFTQGKYGDKYDALRTAYENGASDIELGFASNWLPLRPNGQPHDRQSLLAVVECPAAHSDDDEVAALLVKYHVPDETTTLGKRDCAIVQAMDDRMAQANRREEERQNPLLRLSEDCVASEPATSSAWPSEECSTWGGWTAVHPASCGVEAQTRRFDMAAFEPHRAHPASFACTRSRRRDDDELPHNVSKDVVFADLAAFSNLRPSDMTNPSHALFEMDDCETRLLSEESQSLETRESRTHRFEVPEETDVRFLSLTITVVYRGVFTARGYRVGRVAAAAFRLTKDGSAPIGCAPYAQQQLNTGTSLGRTVIRHTPDAVPLRAGVYHVVLGAASAAKYSITVEARAVQTAAAKLRCEMERAVEIQKALGICTAAVDDMWASMRLAERKMLVVQALVNEAEVESLRCEQETERCNQELIQDDERMDLTEEKRTELYTDVKRLEVEFAHWCRLFASRSQERTDLLASLDVLRRERAEKVVETERRSVDMKYLQRHLPPATCLVHGMLAAVECALALNTSFEHIRAEDARGQWRKLASARGVVTAMMTPAQEVRRRYQTEGWLTLSLPEQQFAILDRTMNPDRYDWLDHDDGNDDATAASGSRGGVPEVKDDDSAATGTTKSGDSSTRGTSRLSKERRRASEVRRINRGLSDMKSLSKGELVRIQSLPFSRVARGKEMTAWKLLRHYHDDPQRLVDYAKRRAMVADSDVAASVRFKHPKSRTKEEREWSSLDRILNPELWRGLKLRDTAAPYSSVLTKEQRREYLDPIETCDEDAKNLDLIKRRGSRLGSRFGSFVQVTLAERTKLAAAQATAGQQGDWECRMSRDELIEIWSAQEPHHDWDVDQCKARRLLETFNGDYEANQELRVQIATNAAKRTRRRHRFFGPHAAETDDYVLETDLDARCRSLQAELDKAVHNSNAMMQSTVLHGGVGQRFPTHILRIELEAELDALLREQVYERERASRYLVEQQQDGDMSAGSSSSSDEEDRRRGAKKPDKLSKAVYRARQAILREQDADGAERERAREIRALGPWACIACMAPRCAWRASVDASAIKARRRQIADELVYVRSNPDVDRFESYVPLSASRGGNPHYRREDLVDELAREDRELNLRFKLHAIDRELHDAYATTKEYVEIRSLHAYPTMMWTSNARRALEREHNTYVATIVATDIVNDALDYMAEGWHFGERESDFSVAGYVPSLKKDGFVRAGTDQVLAQRDAELRDKRPEENDEPGSPRTKTLPIELDVHARLSDEKVVKAGSDREKHMDFTERTLKFGLFCITLMFFRAMALIRREQESWATRDMFDTGVRLKPSDERQKMRREHQNTVERLKKLDLALKRATVGEERTRLRLAKERQDAARKLYAKVRREKNELAACGVLQAAYRGHLGRKAAHRWAVKRAELAALSALMTASAITMERVYRGFVGRTAASVKRMEMAEFISMIRLQEAADDEAEYWRTHTFARLKRDAKVVAKHFMDKNSSQPKLTDQDLAHVQAYTADGDASTNISK